MRNEDKNLELAVEILMRHSFRPKNVSMKKLALNLLDAAEQAYMKDNENRLFRNGILDTDVFETWMSEIFVCDYDK